MRYKYGMATHATGAPPTPAGTRQGSPERVYIGLVGLLTATAFVLRLTGIHQVLFGDELFTYPIVTRGSLWDALSAVHHTSVTPPFHYVLAWVAVQFGAPLVTIRLPSLILGTLTVPLVYLLGARTAGRPAGLLAAALMAISPFAIFYGTEGRAYATLMFLAVVSTLALLQALDTGRRGWWALFAVASCLALYTHYTGLFLVVAQLAWTWWAHPGHRRALGFSAVAIVVGYLPWIPFFLEQRQNKGIEVLASFADLSLDSAGRSFVRAFPGHPFYPAAKLPGRPELVVVAAVLVVALAAAVLRLRRTWRVRPPGRANPMTLILVLALATPVGVILWSLAGKSILLPRTLSASLPAFAVLAATGITRLRRPYAVAAAALLLAAVAVGTVRTQTTDFRNSAFRDAADYVDADGAIRGLRDPGVARRPGHASGLGILALPQRPDPAVRGRGERRPRVAPGGPGRARVLRLPAPRGLPPHRPPGRPG